MDGTPRISSDAMDRTAQFGAGPDDAGRRTPAGTCPEEPPGCQRTCTPIVSDMNGDGEDSMMKLVRHNMMTILQPFCDNVQEIHKWVTRIAVDLTNTSNTVDMNIQTLQEHAELLAALRADLDRTSAQANATQASLESTIGQQGSLVTDYNATKTKLANVDERLTTGEQSIMDLQLGLKDTRCKTTKNGEALAETDRSIAQVIKPDVQRLEDSLNALNSAHEETTKLLEQVKSETEANLKSFQDLAQSHKEQCSNAEEGFNRTDARLHGLDQDMSAAQKDLQLRLEQDQAQEAAISLLKERVDAHDLSREELRERSNKADVRMTDHDVRLDDAAASIQELLAFMIKFQKEMDLAAAVRKMQADLVEHSENITELQGETATHFKRLEDGEERFEELEGEAELNKQRAKRLEKKVGLEPYERRASVAPKPSSKLTQEQLDNFKTQFSKYDQDGDGTMNSDGLGALLSDCGINATPEMLKDILDEIDTDGDGTVDFSEFTKLMEKTGGTGDPAKAAKEAFENMSVVARQKKAYEQIDRHERNLDKHLCEINDLQAHTKDLSERRVETLEKQNKEMFAEVHRLRQSLELSHEYWKGLSKGLKETKRNVHVEGEMMPSARQLRTALPSIVRPSTSGEGNAACPSSPVSPLTRRIRRSTSPGV